jgi:ribonuclease H / adenosylcobalamin/alpha-ribazole phosphatase
MGRLILVRHGESEGNRDRRFTTTPDVRLTDLGRKQAAMAAHRIARQFKPRMVITSPYARARETGRIIADALGLPAEIEPGLYERDFGYLRGQSYDAAPDDPTFATKKLWLWRPRGGESYEDVRVRIAPVIERLAVRATEDDLVVVSHGGVMLTCWAHVTGHWESAQVPPNCGIVLIEHTDGHFLPPQIVEP